MDRKTLGTQSEICPVAAEEEVVDGARPGGPEENQPATRQGITEDGECGAWTKTGATGKVLSEQRDTSGTPAAGGCRWCGQQRPVEQRSISEMKSDSAEELARTTSTPETRRAEQRKKKPERKETNQMKTEFGEDEFSGKGLQESETDTMTARSGEMGGVSREHESKKDKQKGMTVLGDKQSNSGGKQQDVREQQGSSEEVLGETVAESEAGAAGSPPRVERGTTTTRGTLSEDTLETDELETDEGQFASVPVVRVFLLQSVRLLPLQSQQVLVKIDGDTLADPLLLECKPEVKEETGLEVVDSLMPRTSDGISQVVLVNRSGFTQTADKALALGKATQVTVVVPDDDLSGAQATPGDRSDVQVLRVEGTEKTRGRQGKLQEILAETDLPEHQRRQLLALLNEYNDTFSLDEGERGETDLIELYIDTADTAPRRQRARRMPFAVRREVARQLKMMQNLGVIQPSCSPWASPVVLVPKKDGSHRFCVDYRELNSVTKLDSYPLPRIDDLLDQLDQAHYFTTLDLASGYWQIRVHRYSVPKTAFITPQGLFEFRGLRMPPQFSSVLCRRY